jgi:hypothetical protein
MMYSPFCTKDNFLNCISHNQSYTNQQIPMYAAYSMPPAPQIQPRKKLTMIEKLNKNYLANKRLLIYVACHSFSIILLNLTIIMIQVRMQSINSAHASTYYGYWASILFSIFNVSVNNT